MKFAIVNLDDENTESEVDLSEITSGAFVSDDVIYINDSPCRLSSARALTTDEWDATERQMDDMIPRDNTPIEVYDVVLAYIKKNRYDGLYNPYAECACLADDLAPCGEGPKADCIFGYRVPCDCGDDHEYHVAARKESTQ